MTKLQISTAKPRCRPSFPKAAAPPVNELSIIRTDHFMAMLDFYWHDGSKVQMMSIPPGYETYLKTYGNGVNDFGDVVGYENYNDYTGQAYKWNEATGIQGLNGLGTSGAVALGVNNNGDVVGYSYNANGNLHGVLWENGYPYSPVDLLGFLAPPNAVSVAYGINSSGHIAGKSINSFGYYHGFLAPDFGQAIHSADDIGTMYQDHGDTLTSEALAINEDGHIVGDSQIQGGAVRAFLKSAGSGFDDGFTQLGTLGGTTSIARGVNLARDVVGDATLSTGETHGFISLAVPLFTGGGTSSTIQPVTDLNDYVGSDWVIDTATGINDNRYVTGWGYHNGSARAFLLGPLPSHP